MAEVARTLELHKVFEHPFAIYPTSARTGFNIEQSLEWLWSHIESPRQENLIVGSTPLLKAQA